MVRPDPSPATSHPEMILMRFGGNGLFVILIFNIFLSGQLIPISLFPDGLKQFVMNSPFRYMVDFPVSIATESNFNIQYFLEGITIQILWCIIIYLIGRIIYSFGIQQYEAFGA